MTTVLNRDIARVVTGDLVATMTDAGLVLRRKYGRRRVLVTWEELELEYMHDARTGKEAFERGLPVRWLPAVGDCVWVKPWDSVWRGKVAKVLSGLGEEIIAVRLRRTTIAKTVQVLLSQTRPLGKGDEGDFEAGGLFDEKP